MPTLFVCADSGFYNAEIKSILKFGLPLMGKGNFSSSILEFLNLIWQKYGSQTDDQLDKIYPNFSKVLVISFCWLCVWMR